MDCWLSCPDNHLNMERPLESQATASLCLLLAAVGAQSIRNDLEIAAISSQMWYFSHIERPGSASEVL